MENKITGSCCCGSVLFELNDNPKLSVNCHCDDCKKRNGSAFSTYMAVSEDDLMLTKGKDALKEYKVEGKGIKFFCAECGSPIYNKNFKFPGLYMMFYGAFSQPASFSPSFNVFCSSKHDWVDTIGDITSFQASIEK